MAFNYQRLQSTVFSSNVHLLSKTVAILTFHVRKAKLICMPQQRNSKKTYGKNTHSKHHWLSSITAQNPAVFHVSRTSCLKPWYWVVARSLVTHACAKTPVLVWLGACPQHQQKRSIEKGEQIVRKRQNASSRNAEKHQGVFSWPNPDAILCLPAQNHSFATTSPPHPLEELPHTKTQRLLSGWHSQLKIRQI